MCEQKEFSSTITALLEKGVFVLEGEVGGDMVMHAYNSLAFLEGRGMREIEVRIFTNGGAVRPGLDIYDAIRAYPGRKVGRVFAYARSMGAIILQACDDRVCMEHSTVLIHHVNIQSISLDDLENPKRFRSMKKRMLADQKSLYEILARRTARSEKEIRKVCTRDEEMGAQEALEFGLIDRIEL